jgi:hypothetical protein
MTAVGSRTGRGARMGGRTHVGVPFEWTSTSRGGGTNGWASTNRGRTGGCVRMGGGARTGGCTQVGDTYEWARTGRRGANGWA